MSKPLHLWLNAVADADWEDDMLHHQRRNYASMVTVAYWITRITRGGWTLTASFTTIADRSGLTRKTVANQIFGLEVAKFLIETGTRRSGIEGGSRVRTFDLMIPDVPTRP